MNNDQLEEMSAPLQILTPTWEVATSPSFQEGGNPISIEPSVTFQNGSVEALK